MSLRGSKPARSAGNLLSMLRTKGLLRRYTPRKNVNGSTKPVFRLPSHSLNGYSSR